MAVLFDSRVTFANALGFLSFEEQVAGTCPKNSNQFEFVALVARTKVAGMYGKLEKLTERLLARLYPSNLVNTVFQLVF